jgi:hypothetical protein
MGDILVILMGAMDIIAGIIIAIAFHFTTLSIIFGVLMLLKGIMSFNFSD